MADADHRMASSSELTVSARAQGGGVGSAENHRKTRGGSCARTVAISLRRGVQIIHQFERLGHNVRHRRQGFHQPTMSSTVRPGRTCPSYSRMMESQHCVYVLNFDRPADRLSSSHGGRRAAIPGCV